MKAVFCVVILAVFQTTYAQYIKSCGSPIINPCNACGNIIAPPAVITGPSPVLSSYNVPVIQSNSVANSLADTLSLLTVSSLLAETLPLGSNVITLPYGYGGCGCGCGYGPVYY